MKDHTINALRNQKRFILDIEQQEPTGKPLDYNVSICIQGTLYIDLASRRIHICYFHLEWLTGWIPLQDGKLEDLKRYKQQNASRIISDQQLEEVTSTIIHYIDLVEANRRTIEQGETKYAPAGTELFDTSKGLIGIFLDESEWDNLLKTTRKLNDSQKLYLMCRHDLQGAEVEQLGAWRFNDPLASSAQSVWAMQKAIMENHLFD